MQGQMDGLSVFVHLDLDETTYFFSNFHRLAFNFMLPLQL